MAAVSNGPNRSIVLEADRGLLRKSPVRTRATGMWHHLFPTVRRGSGDTHKTDASSSFSSDGSLARHCRDVAAAAADRNDGDRNWLQLTRRASERVLHFLDAKIREMDAGGGKGDEKGDGSGGGEGSGRPDEEIDFHSEGWRNIALMMTEVLSFTHPLHQTHEEEEEKRELERRATMPARLCSGERFEGRAGRRGRKLRNSMAAYEALHESLRSVYRDFDDAEKKKKKGNGDGNGGGGIFGRRDSGGSSNGGGGIFGRRDSGGSSKGGSSNGSQYDSDQDDDEAPVFLFDSLYSEAWMKADEIIVSKAHERTRLVQQQLSSLGLESPYLDSEEVFPKFGRLHGRIRDDAMTQGARLPGRLPVHDDGNDSTASIASIEINKSASGSEASDVVSPLTARTGWTHAMPPPIPENDCCSNDGISPLTARSVTTAASGFPGVPPLMDGTNRLAFDFIDDDDDESAVDPCPPPARGALQSRPGFDRAPHDRRPSPLPSDLPWEEPRLPPQPGGPADRGRLLAKGAPSSPELSRRELMIENTAFMANYMYCSERRFAPMSTSASMSTLSSTRASSRSSDSYLRPASLCDTKLSPMEMLAEGIAKKKRAAQVERKKMETLP